jgi:hypothetical protein
MAANLNRDPDLEWLDHVQPIGLVVATSLLKELGLSPVRQSPIDTGAVAELLEVDASKPALRDPWAFAEEILGWESRHVAGAPGSPAIPDELFVSLPEHATTLKPTWAVAELGDGEQRWQLLVRVERPRGSIRMRAALSMAGRRRLISASSAFCVIRASSLVSWVTDKTLRLIYAPRGETSGHLTFPIRPLGTVAGSGEMV